MLNLFCISRTINQIVTEIFLKQTLKNLKELQHVLKATASQKKGVLEKF